ncbi:prefoldin subunit 1 [Aphidius gifuensis]|uniref:prefoldin subunit 1 n=1 Tax=Aphidius gifuensis TaxID=684658 RepID=UPI001CDC9514|nr:prefoldin subunit 1 [Aphidius gifuensis]
MAANTQDDELKKAFAELQGKVVDTSQKVRLADIQIDGYKRTKQRAELTIKEISGLNTNNKTYELVGRMFMLDDITSIKNGLETKMKTAEEKITALENNKAYLERNLKESKNNIREMVNQRQNNVKTS